MLLYILFSTLFFILIDELVMASTHRRIGPLNLGYYGLLSTLINGINLIITQYLTTKMQLYFGIH